MFMMRRGTPASMAKPVIVIMCTDDAYNSNDEQGNFETGKKLFQYKKDKTDTEN
jgi:hypothetical protein